MKSVYVSAGLEFGVVLMLMHTEGLSHWTGKLLVLLCVSDGSIALYPVYLFTFLHLSFVELQQGIGQSC